MSTLLEISIQKRSKGSKCINMVHTFSIQVIRKSGSIFNNLQNLTDIRIVLSHIIKERFIICPLI